MTTGDLFVSSGEELWMVFIENDCEGFPKIKVEPSSFSLEPASSSTVLTTARKKMSQAEKHRGWVKMKNVSSVKISIQVAGVDKGTGTS